MLKRGERICPCCGKPAGAAKVTEIYENQEPVLYLAVHISLASFHAKSAAKYAYVEILNGL